MDTHVSRYGICDRPAFGRVAWRGAAKGPHDTAGSGALGHLPSGSTLISTHFRSGALAQARTSMPASEHCSADGPNSTPSCAYLLPARLLLLCYSKYCGATWWRENDLGGGHQGPEGKAMSMGLTSSPSPYIHYRCAPDTRTISFLKPLRLQLLSGT